MNTLFRIGSDLLDVEQMVDRQLLVGGQLQREFDVHVPLSIQVDEWEDSVYNDLEEAA